jgi:hypothetical protein
MANLLLTVRRAETPVYRYLKRVAWMLLTVRMPLPGVLRVLYRVLYACHFGASRLSRRVYMFLYGEPMFRSRCDRFGVNCLVWALPVVTGHAKIQIGNQVSVGEILV